MEMNTESSLTQAPLQRTRDSLSQTVGWIREKSSTLKQTFRNVLTERKVAK
jgi:hypothetical protein